MIPGRHSRLVIMNQDVPTAMKTHAAFLLLLLLAASMFLTNIGAHQQFLRAESGFSLGARMMVESNEFLLPHAPHESPLNRPPLQYWVIGSSYKLFGFGHGASRIPSALCGLGTLIVVYILGRRFRGTTVGVTATAMLATSYIFWSFTRLSMPDMLLTFCTTTTLVCWILVLTDHTQHPRALALIGYAAVALGFLAKGPIAIVLTALPIGVEILISRDISIVRRLMPISGSLLFLLIAAPYFVLVYIQDGIEPLWYFFIGENIGRFTGSVAPRAPKPFLIYEITAFLQDFLPWTPLLFIAACKLGLWKNLDQETKRHIRLLGIWILSPIVFFSFSSFKLDYYFLPAMPPTALLLSLILLREGPLPQWAKRISLTVMVVVLVLLPAPIYLTVQMIKANFPDTSLSWLPHVMTGLAFIPSIWLVVRGSIHQGLLACAFILWVAIFSSYLILLPDYTRFHPTATLAASVPPDSNVYTIGKANEWALDMALYLPTSQTGGPLPRRLDMSQVIQALETDPQSVVVVFEKDYGELLKSGLPLQVLAEAEAYMGNKLTLKSLLHPSHATLYLATKTSET